jgi:hypothetical protein
MGANAQTTVPTFTAGQVLTAAQMNNSARTGVPVFADTSARDAGFGGTGEKTLAEGQLCYLEDADVVQYYDGSSWATVGPTSDAGLTLISATTVGTAVASVTVSNAFSATYENYRITYLGGVSSTGADLQMKLGATVTGYYFALGYIPWAGGLSTITNNNGSAWGYVGGSSASFGFMDCNIYRPFQADETVIRVIGSNNVNGQFGGGYLNTTTSYTDFTITPSSGTITGGTIRVYGYKD